MSRAKKILAAMLGMGMREGPPERTASRLSDPWFERKLRQQLDPDDRVGYRVREAAEAKRARKRVRNKAYGLGGQRRPDLPWRS